MSDLYKFGYTLDETIKTMRDVIDIGNHDRMFLDTYYWLKMLSEYREIGTVEECREAVEKQKAKKPIPINYQDYADKIDNAEFFEGSYFCPNCGTVLRSGSYCNRCGQKLGWNENLEGMEDE